MSFPHFTFIVLAIFRIKHKIDALEQIYSDHIYRAEYKHLGKNKLAHVNKEQKEKFIIRNIPL